MDDNIKWKELSKEEKGKAVYELRKTMTNVNAAEKLGISKRTTQTYYSYYKELIENNENNENNEKPKIKKGKSDFNDMYPKRALKMRYFVRKYLEDREFNKK